MPVQVTDIVQHQMCMIKVNISSSYAVVCNKHQYIINHMHSLSFPQPSPNFPNFHITINRARPLTPSPPPTFTYTATPKVHLPFTLTDHCPKVKFVSSNLRLFQSIFEHQVSSWPLPSHRSSIHYLYNIHNIT